MGCRIVRCITSPVNKGSIAFHRRLGFSVKNDAIEKTIDDVSVFEDYDGEGEDRVLFFKNLGKMENA
jgi:RimJ/RimL family protein N-acetyltransferase